MSPVSEKPAGLIGWIIVMIYLCIGGNALWIGIDIWLHAHGYEYLTTEVKEMLKNQLWGPIFVFMWVTIPLGSYAAFTWHFFNTRD